MSFPVIVTLQVFEKGQPDTKLQCDTVVLDTGAFTWERAAVNAPWCVDTFTVLFLF